MHRLKADESYQIGETGTRCAATCRSTRSSAPPSGAAPTRSTPVTASCRRTRELAAACADAGITFVGPSADVLELTGNKARAIAAAREAGLPVLASSAPSASVDELVVGGEPT